MTSYLMAVVLMFALSLTIDEIVANEITYQKVDLENEGQGQADKRVLMRFDWKC